MIRVERGAEISPGVFAYTVPSLGLSGQSRQPRLDACRQIKALLGPTGQLAGLFREGSSDWDICRRVDVGAEFTVKEESAGGIRFGRHEPFARVPPELAQHGPEGGFTPPRGVAGHPNARGGCTNSTATTSEICRRCDISQVTRPRIGKRGVIIKKPGGEQGSGDCNRPHQGRTASDGVPGDLRIEAQAVGALMQRDGWMQFVLSIVRREAAAA
jgi:hypothetical protein